MLIIILDYQSNVFRGIIKDLYINGEKVRLSGREMVGNAGSEGFCRRTLHGREINCTKQWRIQDFPLGGSPTRWGGANLRCIHFLAKTKEIDPVGGARAGGAPWIRQC